MTNYIIHNQKKYPHPAITHIAPALFNADSDDRKALREKGIDFASDSDVIEWAKNRIVDPGVSHIVCKEADFPSHPDWQESWELKNGTLSVNLEKAKNVHINNLRSIRKQKFIDLGFPYKLNAHVENAILDDDTKAKLSTLRDFPKTIDLSNANSVDDIQKIIPDCLK